MKEKPAHQVVIGIVLVCHFSVCFGKEAPAPTGPNRYLNTVREFADNVLKYGRDTYGPKHTPLFVDGLNIHTHEPVKWIAPNGDKWILSNLASQQNLFRTLDGLTKITGDPKYKQAAMDAIKYAFENLRSPNGLIYWGYAAAYNAGADKVFTYYDHHCLKIDYPYYELMWQTDRNLTKKFIEAYWSAHVLDWSNLDFNRYALYPDPLEEPWIHEYEGGPIFFKSKRPDGHGVFTTGTSLTHAAALLSQLSDQKQPLVWGKRLIERYIDTRDPNTGISAYTYNSSTFNSRMFPLNPFGPRVLDYPEERHVHPWLSVLLVGQLLGENGKEFIQWASQELTAWGKVSYRPKENSFAPVSIDGTDLDGYVRDAGPIELNTAKPCPAGPQYFWAYSVAYNVTGEAFIWEMVRNIALGNSLGDVGKTPLDIPELRTQTDCSHPYILLGLLQLYDKTKKLEFLAMARRIGDNIVLNKVYKGYFVPSRKHVYTRFDCIEPLALLHLEAITNSRTRSVPAVWPSLPQFVAPYRRKDSGLPDHLIIYKLTDSNEPPFSLQEAAAMGDLDLVQSIVEKGAKLDGVEDSYYKTALHRAAIAGRYSIVRFLLDKGASVDARDSSGYTPLHHAVERGHKDVVKLLIERGANVDAKNTRGQTPIDVIGTRHRTEIVALLTEHGATISSIHIAAAIGDLARVRAFLENGIDVNTKDARGMTALHYAAQGGHREVVELLVTKGAEVDTWGDTWPDCTPLNYAAEHGHKEVAELLIAKGAKINAKAKRGYPAGDTALHSAVKAGQKDIIELLVAEGADVNIKNEAGQTPLDIALSRNRKDIVELLRSGSAVMDISSIHVAVQMGDLDKVKTFVRDGADPNQADDRGLTPLHHAAQGGHKDIADLLIGAGADVNAGGTHGYPPLYYAIWFEHPEIVQLLVNKGADVNLTPEKDYPPIYYAVWNDDLDTVKLLVGKGARFNVKVLDDRTAFHYAVGQGSREIVEFFVAEAIDIPKLYLAACMGDLDGLKTVIKEGAAVDAKDELGWTPLYWAASMGRTEAGVFLIDRGAEVNIQAEDESTPLHQAAQAGDRTLVERMLSKGADVKVQTKRGNTPLHSAAWSGHRDVAALLIAKGADINAKTASDWTPLHRAALAGHTEVVELLLARGADVGIKSTQGRTALDLAQQRGHTKIVELLLTDKESITAALLSAAESGNAELIKRLVERGADVNRQDDLGLTALHVAASRQDAEIVRLLLARDADISLVDKAGRTVLHYATGARLPPWAPKEGDIRAARVLLDHGAEINRPDNDGKTPLYYSVRLGTQMTELLLNRGADPEYIDHRGEPPLRRTKHRAFYVALEGDDAYFGTRERPFKTITRAIIGARAGDTIYVRDGTYYHSHTLLIEKSGRPGEPIRLIAFPGETAVLNFSATPGMGVTLRAAYWHIKRISVVNSEREGIHLVDEVAHHNVLEDVVVHSCGRTGIWVAGGAAHNLILNCDAYRNFDFLGNGEDADGFALAFSVGVNNVLIGNRAWNNADDGYDLWHAGNAVRLESCYAWRNGKNLWSHPFFTGNANGFKLGQMEGAHLLIRCAAWEHPMRGFDLNGNSTGVTVYNCTALRNRIDYAFTFTKGNIEKNVLRNNLSLGGDIRINQAVNEQHNSWSKPLGVHVTEQDFLSLDDSLVTGPRNPDGSIPESGFLQLAADSDAIDAGTDIGLPFAGKAPDLGASEYDPEKAKRQLGIKWLHQAVRDHDIAKIQSMLSEAADVNEKDWLGYAPLHWACYFGYTDVAELLLDSGADPNLVSDTGRTPLEIAQAMDYEQIAELLRKHGAKE